MVLAALIIKAQVFVPFGFWAPPLAQLDISDGPTFDYTQVPINSIYNKTFTVTNNGKYIANTMSGGSFITTRFLFKDGTYPGTGGTCGVFLSAGSSCTIVVVATSATQAVFNDTIIINYNNGRSSATSQRDVTAQFTPEWLNASWLYRKRITIDSAQVLEALTDFPVYVNLANLGANFFTNVKTDGSDIRVTQSDGITEVPREVAQIVVGSSLGEMHFKVSGVLSNLFDTDFYVYYGNAAASEPAVGAAYGKYNTWNSNYITVWHMNEDTATTSASSNSATNTATFTSTLPNNMTGQLGTGQNFNGTSDRLTTPITTTIKGLTQYTISAWSRTTTVAAARNIYEEQQGTAATSRFKFGLNTNNFALRIRDTDGSALRTAIQPAFTVVTATWYHVVAIYDSVSDIHRMIINGTDYSNSLATVAISNTDPNGVPNIGARPTGAEYWSGDIDEIRISNTYRSLNWGKTEYNNQSSPSTFYAVSAQEAYPP